MNHGGKRSGSGRKQGSGNRTKFPEAIEAQAEQVMLSFLNSDDKKLRFDAARFVLEHNRGRAPQSMSLDMGAGIAITIKDFSSESVTPLGHTLESYHPQN